MVLIIVILSVFKYILLNKNGFHFRGDPELITMNEANVMIYILVCLFNIHDITAICQTIQFLIILRL